MGEWKELIERLLGGGSFATGDGAQLIVAGLDGGEVFRSALARHFRLDSEEDRLIWVRPIAPGATDPSGGGVIYNLNACRRRALSWNEIYVKGEVVHLFLENGQVARIEKAGEKERAELRSWDIFVLGLSVEEERALDELEEDSWWGSHS